MRIIEADFDRRIDLPGVGPCPRPVDIDQAVTGFHDLVSLRVYSCPADKLIHGDAEGDELFIVLLTGSVTVAVDQAGAEVASYPLDTTGGLRAVFLPPEASYRLSTATAADVAYARVLPRNNARQAVGAFAAAAGGLRVADHATGMAISLAAVAPSRALVVEGAGERLVHLSGASRAPATIAAQAIAPWQSLALDPNEQATLIGGGAPAEVLIVAARAG